MIIYLAHLTRYIDLLVNTKLSVITLVIFSVKLSKDARDTRDMIFKSLAEQKSMHTQWLDIFKKLPIGIHITNGPKVLQ